MEIVPGEHEAYLGDGVNADFDGFHIILTTDDGVEVLNTIFLDPCVFRSLMEFGQEKYAKLSAHNSMKRQRGTDAAYRENRRQIAECMGISSDDLANNRPKRSRKHTA